MAYSDIKNLINCEVDGWGDDDYDYDYDDVCDDGFMMITIMKKFRHFRSFRIFIWDRKMTAVFLRHLLELLLFFIIIIVIIIIVIIIIIIIIIFIQSQTRLYLQPNKMKAKSHPETSDNTRKNKT